MSTCVTHRIKFFFRPHTEECYCLQWSSRPRSQVSYFGRKASLWRRYNQSKSENHRIVQEKSTWIFIVYIRWRINLNTCILS